MSTIKRIGTEANPNMSAANVYNGVVYLRGLTDPSGRDLVSQTKNNLAEADRLLAEAGTDKSRLLTADIWLKDAQSGYGPMNAIWASWIDPNNKPTRTCVQADLASPGLLVEIQLTAALP